MHLCVGDVWGVHECVYLGMRGEACTTAPVCQGTLWPLSSSAQRAEHVHWGSSVPQGWDCDIILHSMTCFSWVIHDPRPAYTRKAWLVPRVLCSSSAGPRPSSFPDRPIFPSRLLSTWSLSLPVSFSFVYVLRIYRPICILDPSKA